VVRQLLFPRRATVGKWQLVSRLEMMTSDKTNSAQENPEDGSQEVSAKKKPVYVGIVLTAVLLGGAVGGLVIGPRIVGVVAGQEAAPEPEPEHGAHEVVHGKFFELENLIVNPAGSRGERFLMVSVAFEVPDDEALEALHEREIQVRDVVSAHFSALTLEELAELGARETIKSALSEVIAPFAGSADWLHVYLPRFVIQ